MIRESAVLSGHLRLDSRLAQGGMGDVYVATDLDGGSEQVIVKVLRATDPDDVRRFDDEATALRRLDHPAIVQLLGTGAHEGTPYLVMERIDGPSLKTRIRQGELDLDRVGRIGHDVADALAHAHAHGVIHRDMKPANVLLADGGDGQAHVADFGIARLADVSGVTATGMTMGTAAYLAPEQLRAHGVGPAADVYSLGLVLLEAITGRPAFEGTTTEAAFARLHTDPEVPPDLPTGWRMLLRRMTAREPSDRPEAERVAELLATGQPEPAAISETEHTVELSTAEVRAATPDADAPATREARPRRRRLAQAGGLLATVAAVGAVAFTFASPAQDGDPAETPPATPVEAEEGVEVPSELEDALERLQHEVSR